MFFVSPAVAVIMQDGNVGYRRTVALWERSGVSVACVEDATALGAARLAFIAAHSWASARQQWAPR